jgi:hypothetical protein
MRSPLSLLASWQNLRFVWILPPAVPICMATPEVRFAQRLVLTFVDLELDDRKFERKRLLRNDFGTKSAAQARVSDVSSLTNDA